MRYCFYGLCLDDGGQDLVEYSLLLAFLVFTAFALAGTGQEPIRAIWDKISGNLTRGVASASGGA